ncbi:hypothetical protein SDC9_135852 [bioreactor metagenome]|uniref:ABC transporter ATP-binding protein n=1 Tax=bioreactor metagenome TaxID=1076179 RepID=A0A645DIB5_9ZZZZ|nr:hypothetical protein [Oscillibacter sp.]
MKASIYENGLMGTVSDANKIVVLENGIVNESGSPAELYARGGTYRRMAELQMKTK